MLPPLPGIYQAATWVERISLTETLLPVLQSDRRIIVLTGMTGIGKTALAERLTLPLQDGKLLRRLNLDDGGITPDFSSSGAALLRTLGEEPTLEDQKDAKNLLNHILDRLRTRPHRIQIDSLERLLKEDDLRSNGRAERQGWSEFCDALWLDLWQQVLAGGECQSQIILTTQDVPGELEAIGSRYPQRWHCQPIRGLSEAEQLELFRKAELFTDRTTPAPPIPPTLGGFQSHQSPPELRDLGGLDYLKRIGKLYEGHPLVLRVIAEDIKTCGGDVQRYWQQCRFAELEANRPAKFSRRALQLQVNQRVRDSLQRLPDDARHLLCRSAVYRRPVPESFWLSLLPERTEDQQQAALNLLKARTFAEEDWEPDAWLGAENEIPLRQHNLIRSVAYEMLKADSTWETAERQAADQWLTGYQPAADVPNLEKVRGQIEAFHHLCELANWTAAKTILLDQELGLRLQLWGYYQEMIVLYHRLSHRLSASDDAAYKKGLGNAYFFLSNYKQAIDLYQQSLDLAREIGDRQGQWKALNNLGSVYRNLSDYLKSIEYLQQVLTIAREIGDRQGEGKALGNLGITYYNLGDYGQAIECHQQHLAIAREIGDRQGEGNALGNLGNVYYNLGDYGQAIDCHQQALAITREIGDRQWEGGCLGNLGVACHSLGNYGQAIECHQQRLAIAREIGDRQGEGKALGNLGVAYKDLGDYGQAIEFHQQALAITREIGDRQWEGGCLGNLGITYEKLGNYAHASDYAQQHLRVAQEINDRQGAGAGLHELGVALIRLEQYSESLEHLQNALTIFQDIGSRNDEVAALKNLAELHQKTGEIDLAQQYCDRALGLAIELGIPSTECLRSATNARNLAIPEP